MDAAQLDAIPLFAELTLDQRASVASSCEELAAEAGSTLVQEGDFGYGMFAITSGTADVIIEGAVVRTLGLATCSVRSPCCQAAGAPQRWSP